MQWSYDQLGPDEQRLLLRALGVRRRLDARDRRAGVRAETTSSRRSICCRGSSTSRWCWSTRTPAGEPRYSLLETVRQYAASAWSKRATPPRSGSGMRGVSGDRRARLRRAREQRGEVGRDPRPRARQPAGCARALRDTDAERYLQLAGALAWFWHARSYLVEGRDHLTAALPPRPPTPARRSLARALWGGAYVHACAATRRTRCR